MIISLIDGSKVDSRCIEFVSTVYLGNYFLIYTTGGHVIKMTYGSTSAATVDRNKIVNSW